MDNSRQGTPHPDKTQSRLQAWQDLEAKVPQLEKELKESREENERLKNLLQAEQKEKTKLHSTLLDVLAVQDDVVHNEYTIETTIGETCSFIRWLRDDPSHNPKITYENLVKKTEEIIGSSSASTTSASSATSVDDTNKKVDPNLLLDAVREFLGSIDNQSHAELTEEQAIAGIHGHMKLRAELKKQDEEQEAREKAALEQKIQQLEQAHKAARELENRNFLIAGCVVIGGAIVGLFMYFITKMYGTQMLVGLEQMSSTALNSTTANVNTSPAISGTQNIRTPEPLLPFEMGR